MKGKKRGTERFVVLESWVVEEWIKWSKNILGRLRCAMNTKIQQKNVAYISVFSFCNTHALTTYLLFDLLVFLFILKIKIGQM